MPSTRTIALAAASAGLLTVLTACGGGSSAGSTGTSSSPSVSGSTSSSAGGSTSSSASGTAAAGPATIQLGSTSLGSVLTDAQGRTLYMFVPDKAGASTCYDQCAVAWPPVLTAGAPVAGTGLDDSLLGTTTRSDGSVQVTYNKLPLYLFAKDTAAGDVKGQGVKNVWYVLDAKGTAMKTAP
jgi:predicted lipoprotein with Yx(FWY)xxD motif